MGFQIVDGPLDIPRPRNKFLEVAFEKQSPRDKALDVIDTLDAASETEPNPGLRYLNDQSGNNLFVPGVFRSTTGMSTAGTIYLARELIDKAEEERGIWLDAVRFITAHEWGHAFASHIRTIKMGVPAGALIGDIQTLEQKGLIDYQDIRGPNDEIARNATELYRLIEDPPNDLAEEEDVIGHTMGDSLGEAITDLERDNVDDLTYNLAVEVGADPSESQSER